MKATRGTLLHFLFTAPRYHTNQHFAAKALVDAGHDVSYLVVGRGQSETYEAVHPEVLAVSVVSRTLGRMLARRSHRPFELQCACPPIATFWRRLRALAPDVVVVRHPDTWYGRLAVVTARLNGCTVLYYTQAPLHRPIDPLRRFVNSFRAWVAGARWITPVLGEPDRYPPAVGAMCYVPFVMEPQTAPERKAWFAGDAANVLSIGKFQRRKNHGLLLQAIDRLSARHPVRATVIGECTTAEHREELAKLRRIRDAEGLGDRVRFKTNVPYGKVQEELARHDVFVLASRDETAAISHLEAMAHSLPVICSDANGTKCYVRPGENGFIVRTGDAGDLERHLEAIVSDRDRLVEMGARSYELVVSEHAPGKYVETILGLFGGTGARPPARGVANHETDPGKPA